MESGDVPTRTVVEPNPSNAPRLPFRCGQSFPSFPLLPFFLRGRVTTQRRGSRMDVTPADVSCEIQRSRRIQDTEFLLETLEIELLVIGHSRMPTGTRTVRP